VRPDTSGPFAGRHTQEWQVAKDIAIDAAETIEIGANISKQRGIARGITAFGFIEVHEQGHEFAIHILGRTVGPCRPMACNQQRPTSPVLISAGLFTWE